MIRVIQPKLPTAGAGTDAPSWPSWLILFLLSLPAWALRGAPCRKSQPRNLRNFRWRGAPHPLKPVAGAPLPQEPSAGQAALPGLG